MNTKAPNWIEYIAHYRKPAPVLVVVKVHLWNHYSTGRKPSNGKWKVLSEYSRLQETGLVQLVDIEYPHEGKHITRLRSQVCTEAEYQAYLQALVTGVQIAEAA